MKALRFPLVISAGCAFLSSPLHAQQPNAPPAPAVELEAPIVIEGNFIIRAGGQEALIRAAGIRAIQYQAKCFLQVEYHRARMACDLTADQRSRMVGEAGSIFRETLKQIARESRLKQTRPTGANATPGWFEFVDDALARAVMSHTRADQRARYRAEIERRDADRKQSAILRVIAELDRDLSLSVGQREQVRAALESNWDDGWSIAVDVPDIMQTLGASLSPHVVPLLSDAQKVSWAQAGDDATRRSRRFLTGFPDDEVVSDEMLAKALAAPSENHDVPGAGVVQFPAR